MRPKGITILTPDAHASSGECRQTGAIAFFSSFREFLCVTRVFLVLVLFLFHHLSVMPGCQNRDVEDGEPEGHSSIPTLSPLLHVHFDRLICGFGRVSCGPLHTRHDLCFLGPVVLAVTFFSSFLWTSIAELCCNSIEAPQEEREIRGHQSSNFSVLAYESDIARILGYRH